MACRVRPAAGEVNLMVTAAALLVRPEPDLEPVAPLRPSPLVERCQQGDQEAFDELFALHWRDAVAIARHVVRDPVLAEDIAQEAFIKVYRRIGGFGFRSQFRSWLYRVVVNQAISTLRRRTLKERPDAAPDQLAGARSVRPIPLEELVADADERALVRRTVDSMPPPQRRLIVWKYFCGLTDEQIASRLDCPVGTVKSRLHRARRQLEDALDGRVEQP